MSQRFFQITFTLLFLSFIRRLYLLLSVFMSVFSFSSSGLSIEFMVLITGILLTIIYSVVTVYFIWSRFRLGTIMTTLIVFPSVIYFGYGIVMTQTNAIPFFPSPWYLVFPQLWRSIWREPALMLITLFIYGALKIKQLVTYRNIPDKHIES